MQLTVLSFQTLHQMKSAVQKHNIFCTADNIGRPMLAEHFHCSLDVGRTNYDVGCIALGEGIHILDKNVV